ncbi:MAG: hypothetical protein PHO18_07405 [Synergistaceae bacterium]|nr:hypothetical protein [Synergistaceae bacterium]
MFYGLSIRKNRPNGFLLTELLIALLIFLFAAAPLMSALKISMEKMNVFIDYRKAMNRQARAVSLLKSPIFHCGFGMPFNSERYKESFGSLKFDPFRWNGPISVTAGASGLSDSEIRIAYAMPGSTKLAYLCSTAIPECSLKLHKFPEPGEIGESFAGGASNIRNWIFFSSTLPPSTPLRVTALSGKTMTVRNVLGNGFTILKGDRTYHFRAIRLYCLNDNLYTKDYRSPGYQPRVAGVVDMRFDLDKLKKLVNIYILVRGDIVYSTPKRIIGQETWPADYIRPWIEKQPKHQLYASKIVWRLPNCVEEDVTCLRKSDIAEQF